MIDIQKVRKWVVKFSCQERLTTLPFPAILVGEEEESGYEIAGSSSIPQSEGGQLTLTLSGRGVLYAHGERFYCMPGSAFLYRRCDPHVYYKFDESQNEPWNFVWIQFVGNASSQLIAELNARYGYFFNPGENSLLAHELCKFQKHSGTLLAMSAPEGCRWIMELSEALIDPALQRKTLNRRHIVDNIQRKLSESTADKLSITELAHQFGISREHLSRTFHQTTGQTLKDFKNAERLQHALELLQHTNLSCKEIAQRCRFGSYSSFYRTIKDAFNQTPEALRSQSHLL